VLRWQGRVMDANLGTWVNKVVQLREARSSIRMAKTGPPISPI
jgi:hypothetical protein